MYPSVIYYCITNGHKRHGFKQHTFIYYLTVLVDQDLGHSFIGSSAHSLTRLKLRCWLGCILIWSLDWERFTPKFTQAVGKIYLLAVVWLSSPIPCWMSARGQSQLLEASNSSPPCGLLHGLSHKWHLTSSKPARGVFLSLRKGLVPLSKVFTQYQVCQWYSPL